MKKNKRGFILTETIIISSVILTTLLIVYTQFIKVLNNYKVTFEYNTVDDLYAINNVNIMLKNNGLNDIKNALNTNNYIDISACPVSYIIEYKYCKELLKHLNIKTLLIASPNIDTLKLQALNNIYSQEFTDFIKRISPKNEKNYLRVIAEFNDNSYATLFLVDQD